MGSGLAEVRGVGAAKGAWRLVSCFRNFYPSLRDCDFGRLWREWRRPSWDLGGQRRRVSSRSAVRNAPILTVWFDGARSHVGMRSARTSCCSPPTGSTIARSPPRSASRQTVRTWRERFAKHRLAGLCDEPRCGAPSKIGDDQIEAIVVKTLEEKPKGATHWSTRDMAKASGVSASSVQRIWRAFSL